MDSASVIFVSTNFPSGPDAGVGSYNLNQLRALRDRGFRFSVVAPAPWFPLIRSRSVPLARELPDREQVDGFSVAHPRAIYFPLSRGAINGWLYARSLRRTIARCCQAQRPDFLWTSFAFPDGVGMSRLAQAHGLPHVVSVVGSDLNTNVDHAARQRALVRALSAAHLVLAKSRALGDGLMGIGVPKARIRIDYNGVDRGLFAPRPRDEACSRLAIPAATRRILFVGSLVPVKNAACLIEAFDEIRRVDGSRRLELVLIGSGRLERGLRDEVTARGLSEHVRFEGPLAHDHVALWMAASDLLCLPSLSEGVPNVVLEALSSGRPVVASHVGGVPEVHPGEAAGALVPAGDVTALARALSDTLDRRWDPESLATLTAEYTWEHNARALDGWFAEAGLRRPASTLGSEPARGK